MVKAFNCTIVEDEVKDFFDLIARPVDQQMPWHGMQGQLSHHIYNKAIKIMKRIKHLDP